MAFACPLVPASDRTRTGLSRKDQGGLPTDGRDVGGHDDLFLGLLHGLVIDLLVGHARLREEEWGYDVPDELDDFEPSEKTSYLSSVVKIKNWSCGLRT